MGGARFNERISSPAAKPGEKDDLCWTLYAWCLHAQGKKEALEARGIPVGINPTEAARIAAERVRPT